jgi:hypothetical protein
MVVLVCAEGMRAVGRSLVPVRLNREGTTFLDCVVPCTKPIYPAPTPLPPPLSTSYSTSPLIYSKDVPDSEARWRVLSAWVSAWKGEGNEEEEG